MTNASLCSLQPALASARRFALAAALLGGGLFCVAQAKPAANPAPDVLVLSNGDTLHGKLVSEVDGKVTFHSDPLGDVTLAWDKIKELHSAGPFAVLDSRTKSRGKRGQIAIRSGAIAADSKSVTVQPAGKPALAPIPLKNAQFIMGGAALDKQINHSPGFFSGWNGAATAGATLVTAAENQYTVTAALGLVREVPTVSWLNPRNRTSTDFSGSFGKISQPGYYVPPVPPATTSTYVPPQSTKSSILHFDAERDQYFSPRLYALVQSAFDHNFAQDLQLQQIYGGGIGWTILKSPKRELDLKATAQYEKQSFITGTTTSGTNPNQNLIGSTLAANYLLHLKLFTLTQQLSYIPAFNQPSAYSANETNTFAFPAYKEFSFSLGTIDTFLNDPPIGADPPAKKNSFQVTMGLTYSFKSKY
jgi:Protein of unknown function, DUF481